MYEIIAQQKTCTLFVVQRKFWINYRNTNCDELCQQCTESVLSVC